MEMMEMVSKVVSTLKGDQNMLTAFTGDPMNIVKKILGGGLSDSLIKNIIQEVVKQLGSLLGPDALKSIASVAGLKDIAGAAADTAKDAAKEAASGGILGKIKNLF